VFNGQTFTLSLTKAKEKILYPTHVLINLHTFQAVYCVRGPSSWP